jgi:hypothetical protein
MIVTRIRLLLLGVGNGFGRSFCGEVTVVGSAIIGLLIGFMILSRISFGRRSYGV